MAFWVRAEFNVVRIYDLILSSEFEEFVVSFWLDNLFHKILIYTASAPSLRALELSSAFAGIGNFKLKEIFIALLAEGVITPRVLNKIFIRMIIIADLAEL